MRQHQIYRVRTYCQDTVVPNTDSQDVLSASGQIGVTFRYIIIFNINHQDTVASNVYSPSVLGLEIEEDYFIDSITLDRGFCRKE